MTARWLPPGLMAALLLLPAPGLAQNTGVNPTVGSVWTYLGPTYGAGWAVPPQVSLPYAPTNGAMGTLVTAAGQVYRAGFYAPGDGGAMTYTHSSTPCSLNGGNGDNGAQLKAADGGCWLAAFGASYDVRVWGAKADGAATNSQAQLNAATSYAGSVGGTVDLAGGTYGVCTASVTLNSTNKRIVFQNGRLSLQTGCGAVPQEILVNSVVTNDYATGATLSNVTLDGKCTTKYVYRVQGGDHTVHHGVSVMNPAPNATIADSAGVYIVGGTELKFGAGNFVSATGTCYNGGNLPSLGILHSGANADFSGVVVINFITGILGGADDFFGPGTHVWSGCRWDPAGNGGLGACVYDAALRGDAGIYLSGAGGAYGVEVDDAKVAGVVLKHIDANDRMTVIGTVCPFSATPTATQNCVVVTTGTKGSLVSGTGSPQLAAAGFAGNVVYMQPAVDPSTTVVNNAFAVAFGGEAPTRNTAAQLPPAAVGCVGQTGYISGAASQCQSFGWITSAYNGCSIKSFKVELDAAPGAGKQVAVIIQDNGADTPMAVYINDANFGDINNTNLWSILPNHSISLRIFSTGATPAANLRASIYGCG